MLELGNKVVYQVYPKSFKDSNGDGHGDLRGIIQKLDYLKGLGIDYLWITPVFVSPMNDNGYDVADYYRINPKFGGSAWEYVPFLGQWYLHLYDVSQADLNWENPRVREELKKVIRFWKSKGVKGFRFDVVNVISKPEVFEDDLQGDGRRFYTDGPHVHEYIKELTEDTEIADMITVGEMSSTSLDNCIRYSNPKEKELSMCFNFHHLKVDYKNGDKWSLMEPDRMALKKLFEEWQEGMQEANGWNSLFWCNHDQPRVVSRFGDEKTIGKSQPKCSLHLFI